MGIDLYCNDKTFGCGYGSWYNIRTALIEATFEYLEVHFAVSEYEEGISEHGSMFALKQYIEKIHTNKINGKNLNLFDNFYACLGILEFVDLLIQFGVGGLYALCNKMDCEGCYSVGNSYDIIEFFKLIRPFIINDNDNLESLAEYKFFGN